MLTHAQLTECSKIYSEFAEKHGKLPKQFREATDDFCKVFAEYLPDAVSVQIRQWFKAYLADYLPLQTADKTEARTEKLAKVAPLKDSPKPETLQEKARKLHAKGFSFVQIGKELGVSDKTAKKYVTEV